MLKVSKIFMSMQGEGCDVGKPTIFVRMHGCSMGCDFCDENAKTDHIEMTTGALAGHIIDKCGNVNNVVFTGGEPLEQANALVDICAILVRLGFTLGVETNGAHSLGRTKNYWDVISLSPKVHIDDCKIKKCTNLKILYPYITCLQKPEGKVDSYLITAEMYKFLDSGHKYIQPLWGSRYTDAFDEVCNLGDKWKLGLQTHKLIDFE